LQKRLPEKKQSNKVITAKPASVNPIHSIWLIASKSLKQISHQINTNIIEKKLTANANPSDNAECAKNTNNKYPWR